VCICFIPIGKQQFAFTKGKAGKMQMTLAKKYTLTYFLKEYTYCHCYGAIQYMIHNHNMDENWYGRTKRDTDGVYQEPRRVFKVNLNLKTQEQKPNNTEHKPDSIPQAHKTCPCDAT